MKPPDLEFRRQGIVMALQVAYARIKDEKKENFGLWMGVRHHVVRTLKAAYAADGWQAAPLMWDAFWKRLDLAVPSNDPLSHVELVEALCTDYGPRVREHIRYRLSNGGNVHVAICGVTGIGKSSCAIGLADWIKPIHPPERLLKQIFINDSDLPRILPQLEEEETALKDETPRTAGEGSRTQQQMYANIEDTIRKSRRNLVRLSPDAPQEESTMQLVLEVILWNPDAKKSRALCWVKGRVMGYMDLPWCRTELYAVYEPWKDSNVEGSLAGQFKDTGFVMKQALALTSDQRFVDFIQLNANKPKVGDFRSAIELFPTTMMTQDQTDRLARVMHDTCYNYQRLEKNFEGWFGVRTNRGLEEIARKCYT